jgi:hypothetical protein
MTRKFVEAIALTAFMGGLTVGAMGCGAPEQELPEQATLGVEQSELTVTRSDVTAGECEGSHVTREASPS